MKLLSAVLVYLVFAALLGTGVVLLMSGKPALLIGSGLVFALMFARYGCASH